MTPVIRWRKHDVSALVDLSGKFFLNFVIKELMGEGGTAVAVTSILNRLFGQQVVSTMIIVLFPHHYAIENSSHYLSTFSSGDFTSTELFLFEVNVEISSQVVTVDLNHEARVPLELERVSSPNLELDLLYCRRISCDYFSR